MNLLCRFLLVTAVLAAVPAMLQAQSIQYRSKVSDTLPRYVPKVQL